MAYHGSSEVMQGHFHLRGTHKPTIPVSDIPRLKDVLPEQELALDDLPGLLKAFKESK